MTEIEYARTVEEMDRLLNNPDVPLHPSLIWSLLDKVSKQDSGAAMLSRLLRAGCDRQTS
jgi:hypothetical protein